MTTSLEALTIAQAADLIAARELSPVAYLEHSLRRHETIDNIIRSVPTLVREQALAQAREAEAEIMRHGVRGPLHGIPYVLKDNFEARGVRTTVNSRLLADHVSEHDSTVHSRLQGHGAILLGKATMWELAHGSPSDGDLLPAARNPWDPACDPGGSSSGSAAAVAAGICPVSIGTDTGGSVRSPAAACGIVGLKPSFGRVSRFGLFPNSGTHDHCGPLARSVEDLAIVLQAIAGHDPLDGASADISAPDYRSALADPPTGLVAGIPERWLDEAHASQELRERFDAAVSVLRMIGIEIRTIALPPIAGFEHVKKVIGASELFATYGRFLRKDPGIFGLDFSYRILAGGLVRAEDYINALGVRASLQHQVCEALRTVDLIITPTEELLGDAWADAPDAMFDDCGFLTAFNVARVPALALPMGFSRTGMPLSLQIVGRMFDEATVLRAGHWFEKATNWNRRPSLGADE